MTRIAKETDGYRVTWSTVPGKHYTLLFGQGLSAGDFFPVFGAEDIIADGTTANFLDTVDGGLSGGFFRVKVAP